MIVVVNSERKMDTIPTDVWNSHTKSTLQNRELWVPVVKIIDSGGTSKEGESYKERQERVIKNLSVEVKSSCLWITYKWYIICVSSLEFLTLLRVLDGGPMLLKKVDHPLRIHRPILWTVLFYRHYNSKQLKIKITYLTYRSRSPTFRTTEVVLYTIFIVT